MSNNIVSVSDRRVAAIPVRECGEDLRAVRDDDAEVRSAADGSR
ncbi:hypothetical protein [Streptomyces sp. NPDC006134]